MSADAKKRIEEAKTIYVQGYLYFGWSKTLLKTAPYNLFEQNWQILKQRQNEKNAETIGYCHLT